MTEDVAGIDRSKLPQLLQKAPLTDTQLGSLMRTYGQSFVETVVQAAEPLLRGVVDHHPYGGLVEKLAEAAAVGRPLVVKAGFDPTAPDLHLGHAVLLQKLRQFQQAGHTVVFLIGDFTALIGDPTGRSDTRPPLSRAQIDANAATYAEQVFKLLDREATVTRYNSEWLDQLTGPDWIRLASEMTLARMLERDDFAKRYRENLPIRLHEFLYPLIQGFDSVALAADVELGGTDQLFNLLVGRELQRSGALQPIQRRLGLPESPKSPQVVLTVPLLEGLDGTQKMSKSYGNAVGILEPPEEQFGKLMSISDELMLKYYRLLTDQGDDAVAAAIQSGELHPMEAKKRLAFTLVARFHGPEAAAAARAEFERVFSGGERPSHVPQMTVALGSKGRVYLLRVLVEAGFVASLSEGRRKLQEGAIRCNGARVHDPDLTMPGTYLIQFGKRHYLELTITP